VSGGAANATPEPGSPRADAVARLAERIRAGGSVTLGAGGEIAIVTQRPTHLDADAVVKLGGDVVAELEALLVALTDRD
jgi:hypothetical protein